VKYVDLHSFRLAQGAYNSEKPGKPRENSGNIKFTHGISVSVIVGIEFCT